jgi:hypothetical protein
MARLTENQGIPMNLNLSPYPLRISLSPSFRSLLFFFLMLEVKWNARKNSGTPT